jgi:hypothetical protein
MDLKFNWIGQGFSFGQQMKFFCISAHALDLVFSIRRDSEGHGFVITRETKNIKTINRLVKIEEDVKNIFLIVTDEAFEKKFKRAYYILKFETENYVATVGTYTDNVGYGVANTYVLCTTDFINLLAATVKVETADQLRLTDFGSLMCIIDKNEMTKELLRE